VIFLLVHLHLKLGLSLIVDVVTLALSLLLNPTAFVWLDGVIVLGLDVWGRASVLLLMLLLWILYYLAILIYSRYRFVGASS